MHLCLRQLWLPSLALFWVVCCPQSSAQSAGPREELSQSTLELMDFALQPPVINTNPGSEYADTARSMNMVIGMDQSPGGRIWAAWVSGGDSELAYFVVATSDDGGDSWSPPRLVIDPTDHPTGIARRVLVGNFWTDPDGRLWLFFDQSMGKFDGRAGVWVIRCDNPDDAAPTWTQPRRIWHGATLNKPLVMSNGEWLLPISLWRRSQIGASSERHRPAIAKNRIPDDFKYAFADLDDQRQAHVFVSTDKGETWTRRGGVEFPHFNFDEHMIVELKDKRLWMLARTQDGMYESMSDDQGRTWSEPAYRFPHRNARFFIRRLSSGKLLLVRHGQVDEKTAQRSHLRAFLSDDDGQNWQGGLLLDERSGISYPDGFQAADGTIRIIYDRDRYSTAEILMTAFREEDVLAGQFKSPQSRQRVIVNRATGQPPEKP